MMLSVNGRIEIDEPDRFVIGFTGTRRGMADKQKEAFIFRVKHQMRFHHKISFHHGGCIGADEDAHYMARDMGLMTYVHPSDIEDTQAMLSKNTITAIYDAKPPLDRNIDIVKACDLLIATPAQKYEVIRSGTMAYNPTSSKIQKEPYNHLSRW